MKLFTAAAITVFTAATVIGSANAKERTLRRGLKDDYYTTTTSEDYKDYMSSTAATSTGPVCPALPFAGSGTRGFAETCTEDADCYGCKLLLPLPLFESSFTVFDFCLTLYLSCFSFI